MAVQHQEHRPSGVIEQPAAEVAEHPRGTAAAGATSRARVARLSRAWASLTSIHEGVTVQAVAAWCVRHRRLVVAGWLLVLILVTGLARTAGSSFSNVFSLPGTGSAEAAALLTAVSPKVSGDTEQVVVATSGRTLITDPAVRSRVDAMLARVADVAHVTQVVSPYRPSGAAQVSRGRHVAYATVTFDRPSWDIPMSTASHLLHAVASGNGDGVSAAVGGAVAKQAESPSLSSTGIGIIAASVVLALVFGSLFATALPLVSALVSLGTASGVLALLSHAMSISTDATTLMALISLGVGVDYALFIVTRHRQGLLAVAEVEQSIVTSVNSSGRAVLVAGTIVCVALLGMLALGVNFLSGVAVATAVGVALTMAASLTLLPALLGFIGPRVLSRRQRARVQRADGTRRSGARPGAAGGARPRGRRSTPASRGGRGAAAAADPGPRRRPGRAHHGISGDFTAGRGDDHTLAPPEGRHDSSSRGQFGPSRLHRRYYCDLR